MKRALESSPFTLLAKPCPPKHFVETVRRMCHLNETRFLKKNHKAAKRPQRGAGESVFTCESPGTTPPIQFRKKILIAEDDKKIGAALEIRLGAAGYEVLVLSDGFRSYMRSVTDHPDLILMDIFLPIGSGLAMAQELRRAGLVDIPIIFMTASKRRNLRAKAEELNAVGFFEKPFDMEKLLAAISRVLQSRPSTMVTRPSASAAPNEKSQNEKQNEKNTNYRRRSENRIGSASSAQSKSLRSMGRV
jgi:DNA-binding response OmpR family regulator